MSAAAPKTVPPLSARLIHGRAINAIAELLRSRLSVPEIYLEPRIASALRPDILAVDKAGTGDLHAVEIKVLAIFPTRTQLLSLTERLRSLPYHYKYLAMPSFGGEDGDTQRFAQVTSLFDSRGIGRIGIISFDPAILEDSSRSLSSDAVRLTVAPERFRVPPENLKSVETFLERAAPDMAVRV